ncbi:MAG: hypothetical protein ACI4JI_06795 [Ruminiclostridium sp.]
MKFTRTLASVAAAALAVSSLAVSAFAANPKVELVTLDASSDATKMVQWNIGVLGEDPINTVEISGIVDTSAGWVGGGGAVGFDAIGEDGESAWTQVDFASGEDNTDATTGEFTATMDFGGVKADLAKEGAIVQVGWWWGSGGPAGNNGTLEITDLKVNGESIIGAFAPVVTVSRDQDYVNADVEKLDIGLEAQFDNTTGIAEWPSLPKTTFRADGSDAVITYDFSQFGAPVKFGGNYVALATVLDWADYDENPDKYSAENVAIKSIKFDGVEYGDYTKLALNNEAAGCLRITLMNEWNDNFKGGNAPLSGIELPEFTTLEITIAVTAPVEEEVPGETTEPTEPEVPGNTETPSEILPGESSGNPVSPDTGVAVTVIPAALAAAALATTGIVLKKRSK